MEVSSTRNLKWLRRIARRKGFENDIIGHFCPIASDQPGCKLVLHTNYKSDQGRDVRKKAL